MGHYRFCILAPSLFNNPLFLVLFNNCVAMRPKVKYR